MPKINKDKRKKKGPETQKRKHDQATSQTNKINQTKAKKAALSHMQDIDLRIKKRVDEHWRKALKDPLYKRALAKNNRVFTAVLDEYVSLGAMNVECERGCGAVHFLNERTRFQCCDKTGHGSFELLQDLDPFWKELLEDRNFRDNIRHYNCIFQIATLESKWNANHDIKDGIIVHSDFPYYIRVHGQLFHSCPPAIAKSGVPARFIQLYIIDNALEEIMKIGKNNNLDKVTIERILNYLNENNPWAQAIRRTVKQHMEDRPNVKTVVIDFMPHTCAPDFEYSLTKLELFLK